MCNMTRQHFEFIAETIGALEVGQPYSRLVIASIFASRLKATNPQFKIEVFLDKCQNLEGDANFEAQRLDDKYDGVPADTGSL